MEENSDKYSYCICGGTYSVKGYNGKTLICKTCKQFTHSECAFYEGTESDFECLLCKVQLLDPFNTVKEFLWYSCMGNKSESFVLDASDLSKWCSKNQDVYMASIPLGKPNLVHEWPKTMELKVNRSVVHVVKEPSWEHKRRDNPIKITYAMKSGNNSIEIDTKTYGKNGPLFFIIIFICRQNSVQRIIESIKRKRTIPLEDSRRRIHDILNCENDDDEIVCIDTTHKIELNCPITLDRIAIPARGKNCKHLQCYDLEGYLKVMEKTSAFNMRWKCPECCLIVKPFDLVVDTFIDDILKKVRPSVIAVVLDTDLNYKTITRDNINEPLLVKEMEATYAPIKASAPTLSSLYDTSTMNTRTSKKDLKFNLTDANSECITLDSDEESDNIVSGNTAATGSFASVNHGNVNNLRPGTLNFRDEVIIIIDSDDEPVDKIPSQSPGISSFPLAQSSTSDVNCTSAFVNNSMPSSSNVLSNMGVSMSSKNSLTPSGSSTHPTKRISTDKHRIPPQPERYKYTPNPKVVEQTHDGKVPLLQFKDVDSSLSNRLHQLPKKLHFPTSTQPDLPKKIVRSRENTTISHDADRGNKAVRTGSSTLTSLLTGRTAFQDTRETNVTLKTPSVLFKVPVSKQNITVSSPPNRIK